MPAGYAIEFREVLTPVTELVTKFGGQPVWKGKPCWPIGKSTGKPMEFICQVVIPKELFPNAAGKVVYLFMAAGDSHETPSTWEPDSGDNAAIVQPDGNPDSAKEQADGPTLHRWVESEPNRGALKRLFQTKVKRERRSCEFVVRAIPYESETSRPDRDAEHFGGGTKLGGRPDFVQGEEYPAGEGWRLLMQIDSARVPFDINFGDAGIGYLFLSQDGSQAKFLWQCL